MRLQSSFSRSSPVLNQIPGYTSTSGRLRSSSAKALVCDVFSNRHDPHRPPTKLHLRVPEQACSNKTFSSSDRHRAASVKGTHTSLIFPRRNSCTHGHAETLSSNPAEQVNRARGASCVKASLPRLRSGICLFHCASGLDSALDNSQSKAEER
jgi:hypothetical protein